jgi:tetratricopeptide (TPR) repeat protein
VVGEIFFVHSGIKHLSGPDDYVGAMLITGSIAVCGIILSIMWTPQISDFLISPLTDMFDGGKQPPEPKPYYSIAISKRKLNKPLEAVVAVREQLAKFPNDFEGITLLANIQAEDMKDLQSAEITFNHFCDLPDAPPRQVAAAWTQMADWHLKIAQDSDSARDALEKIIAKFPGSELSTAAAQRIAHLGGVEKILLAAHDRQPVFVPEGRKSQGFRDSMQDLIPDEADPEKLAADYVKHLERHPLDTEAREKLAIIYARHYKRLDLAALELEQLTGQPDQPAKRVAHWLNLLADLQVHGGADHDTVRATLLKIVERFPDLPVAEIARTRLGRLNLELKGQKKTPDIKLGVYEQNIGLKYGSPR